MLLNTGKVIYNRYRITKLLGKGGFGAVYRAWDLTLRKPCALKQNFETSPEAQKQFESEAVILAHLNHPALPRVTDHFTIAGEGQYLVMDFIEGEDLQQLLDNQTDPLSERQVLPWIEQVCDALIYLHDQNPPIIHRDIKPANIKITPQGSAVLVDFGIAKVYDPDLKTTIGARAVTPGYSPLEQYGRGSTDTRSDVYALGALLYTLLTGRELPESTQRAVNDTVIPADQLNPAISPQVVAAINRAIQLAAANRYQKVADFKRALNLNRDVVSPTPVPKPAATRYASLPPTYATSSSRKSWKKWVPLIGLFASIGVIGLIAISVVAFMVFGGGSRRSANPTATPVKTLAATQVPSPTLNLVSTQPPTSTPDITQTQAVLIETTEALETLTAVQDARVWPVLVLDNFDDNQYEWIVGDIDDDFSTLTVEVDGQYSWDAVAKRGFVWRVWPRSDSVTDFYLAVDVQNLSDNLEARYGLVFWNYETSYCYLEVRDSGYFLISQYDGQNWNDLVSYTYTSAIQPGEINRLEVIAADENLYILINGLLVAETIGSAPTEGQAGLAIGLSEEGESSLIVFDDFELRAP